MSHDCPKCGRPWICGVLHCDQPTAAICQHCWQAPAPAIAQPATESFSEIRALEQIQPQGKLTMLDALKYIHSDPRFMARPKDSIVFAIAWDERGTWMMHFHVEGTDYRGTPHIFKPSTLFAEWEIVRPDQVSSNLHVAEVRADV
ncbi:MAG: hypothetical protein JWO13_810 [Acidobacteriales bacterium]|nr:hypothetical protein [Terriglobales bacterium]